MRSKNYVDGILVVRESEGTFQYGNYRREADDLHTVIQHFSGANRAASTILGHSKGALDVLHICEIYSNKIEEKNAIINYHS